MQPHSFEIGVNRCRGEQLEFQRFEIRLAILPHPCGVRFAVLAGHPHDVASDVRIAVTTPIAGAYRVNFLEDRQEPIAVDGAEISVRLEPHQIRTIELT